MSPRDTACHCACWQECRHRAASSLVLICTVQLSGLHNLNPNAERSPHRRLTEEIHCSPDFANLLDSGFRRNDGGEGGDCFVVLLGSAPRNDSKKARPAMTSCGGAGRLKPPSSLFPSLRSATKRETPNNPLPPSAHYQSTGGRRQHLIAVLQSRLRRYNLSPTAGGR